jgi:hypothetical protein
MMQLRAAGNRLANIGAVVISLLLCLGCAGCGYRLYPAGDTVGKQSGPITANVSTDSKKVFVAVFTNNTPEANIETGFRNAFIDQFIKGRRFKIVNAEGLADAVLKGNIKNLIVSPLAYRGESNLAVEKRITVTISLTLEEKGSPTARWHEPNFTQWGDYSLEGTNFSAGQASQKNALSKLANDVAERAYRLMTADF